MVYIHICWRYIPGAIIIFDNSSISFTDSIPMPISQTRIALGFGFCVLDIFSQSSQIFSLDKNWQKITWAKSRSIVNTYQKTIFHVASWENWCFGQFYLSRFEVLQITQLLALVILMPVSLVKENLRGLCEILKRKIQTKVCKTGKWVLNFSILVLTVSEILLAAGESLNVLLNWQAVEYMVSTWVWMIFVSRPLNGP